MGVICDNNIVVNVAYIRGEEFSQLNIGKGVKNDRNY